MTATGSDQGAASSPLVIRVARGYLAKITLGCAIALAGLVWLVLREAVVSWLIAVSVAAFGLAPIAAPLLVARMRVTLTAHGIAVRSMFGETVARWQAADVRLIAAPHHLQITADPCRRSRWFGPPRPDARCTILLKGDWFGMTTEELARTILEFRARAALPAAGPPGSGP